MLRLQETETAVGLENTFNFSLIGESAKPEDQYSGKYVPRIPSETQKSH